MYGNQNAPLVNNVPPSIPRPPNSSNQYHGNYGGYGQTDYGMYGPDFAQQAGTSLNYNEGPVSSYMSESQTVSTNANYGNQGAGYMQGGGYGYGMGGGGMGYNENAQISEVTRVSTVSSTTGGAMIGGTAVGGMGVATV